MKAKIKEDFTMGGIFYKKDEIKDFTVDQVLRLSHLLEEITSNQENNKTSFLENTACDKMIGSEKRGRGRPKKK